MKRYKVVDNEFNRENYPNWIGMHLDYLPPYAEVEVVEVEVPEYKFNAKDYNFVAKRIREAFPNPSDYGDSRAEYLSVADKLSNLAISFALKYFEDNPDFDPLKFLDQCSPDPDQLPLSELWEEAKSNVENH